MNKDKQFIKEIKKYLPTKSRLDAGVDFNLKKIHFMIDEYLGEQKELTTLEKLDELQNKIILLRYDVSDIMEDLE